MLKTSLFSLVSVLIGTLLGLGLVEGGVRVFQDVKVKSTWLEMHPRGFMMNFASRTALHTMKNREVRYRFSKHRTRGGEILPSKENVFCFGDSFTFGLFLNEKDTYVSKLQEQMPDSVQLVNAGIGGSGIADWVALLETMGDTMPIDQVLFIINYDDFARALSKNLYVVQKDSLVPSQRWSQGEIKTKLDRSKIWSWLQEHSHILSWLQSRVWVYYYEDLTKSSMENYPVPKVSSETEQVEYTRVLAYFLINHVKTLCDRQGWKFQVVTTGYLTSNQLTNINAAGLEGLKQACKELNIPFFDATASLSNVIHGKYERITIPGDSHPDEKGAAIIAEILTPFLQKELLDKTSQIEK